MKQGSPALISAIKDYGTWAKITENTWAIVTNKSAVHVRDNLKPFIGQGGRLFILKSGAGAAWSNVACTNEWLQKNL